MFIKSLELTNFKRFKSLKLDFPSDITVIKGLNEQGKSTIAEALIVALFYDPAKSNEDIRNCKAWGCDTFYTIKLEFEANGEEYILEKDFEGKKISLKNSDNAEIAEDYKAIMRQLGQLGGYQTPELFFNTACVKQGELAVFDKKQTIIEAMQNIVSGGGANVSLLSIFSRIEKAQAALTRGLERGLAKNPGRILLLKNELLNKSKELDEEKRIFEEEDKSRKLLGKLLEERDKKQQSIEVKDRVYNDNVRYFESQKMLKGLNGEHEKTSKTIEIIEKLIVQRSNSNGELMALKKFSDIDIKPFLTQRHKIEYLAERIRALENQIKEMTEKGISEIINLRYMKGASIFVALGFLGFFFSKLFFLSWVALGCFSLWFVFSNSVFLRISRKKLTQERDKHQAEKEGSEKEFSEGLKRFGVTQLEEVEEKRKSFSEVKNKIEVVNGKIETLLQEGSLEKLIQRKRELEKRIGVEEQKNEKYKHVRFPTQEEKVLLERDLGFLKTSVYDLDKKIAGIEAMLERAKASSEGIVLLEEKVYMLSEDLKQTLAREKMLAVLAPALREAQQKTFSATREIVEEYIGEFISEITEGKYSAISIGPQMKIKVMSPEKGEEVEPENNLSAGTIEQLYLVARFALISTLYSGSSAGAARPLVVLDDPFGNFDPRRKARTRHILKKLSEKFQILLLTCSNEYDKWGQVIDLAVVT